MKIYAGYIMAMNASRVESQTAMLLAVSKEDALSKLRVAVLQVYPPEDGFFNHFCDVDEVSASLYYSADGYEV